MFRNYFVVAVRNLMRYKVYSLINILGLAVGMACVMLIMLWVRFELSFDRFHEHADTIYRVVVKYEQNNKTYYSIGTPAPLARVINEELPGIREAARLGAGNGPIIGYKQKQFRIDLRNEWSVDPSFFTTFSFPFVQGYPSTALNDIHSVVITQKLSSLIFGDEDPMGKQITIGEESDSEEFTVTGVIRNPPPNTLFQFDYVVSFLRSYRPGNEGNVDWMAWNYGTYVRLQENVSIPYLEKLLTDLVKKQTGETPDKTPGDSYQLFLQPLLQTNVNLNPINSFPTLIASEQVYLFLSIALLILILAGVNFINLTTALFTTRAKEIGIRKVHGACSLQVVRQFLGEAMCLSIPACILSIPIAELFLPIFNAFLEVKLSILNSENISFLLVIMAVGLVFGILASLYPSFLVSRFNPLLIPSKQLSSGKSIQILSFRNALVIIQFTVSIGFIVCMRSISAQLDYIRTTEHGYDQEHIIVIPIFHKDVKPIYELYKSEIQKNSSVLGATATSYRPSELGYLQNVYFKYSGKNAMSHMSWISVDYDFIKTLGLHITIGRDFTRQIATDHQATYILNESAVKRLGWDNPINEQMRIINWGSVIGVIKDFHFQSFRERIHPVALCFYPPIYRYLMVRIRPDNVNAGIASLKQTWENVFPEQPFEYSFLDEDFNNLYKSELKQNHMLLYISLLAIFIACFGLLGLTSFSIAQKTKEIGIRKVLGATTSSIIYALIKEYTWPVLIANLIAWPIAWYAMSRWLQNFAYRIELGPGVFLLSGLIALAVAMLTVSWQTWKAARANPVEALRYE